MKCTLVYQSNPISNQHTWNNHYENKPNYILHSSGKDNNFIVLWHLFKKCIWERSNQKFSLTTNFLIMNQSLIKIQHQCKPSIFIIRQRLQIRSWLWLKVEHLLQYFIILYLLLQLGSSVVLSILLLGNYFLLFLNICVDSWLSSFTSFLLLFFGFLLEEF